MNSEPADISEVSGTGTPTPEKPRSFVRLCFKWILRLSKFALVVVLLYLLCALIGLIPANRGFEQTSDGVPLSVFAGPVHCDLIVPVENQVVNWRDHFPPGDFDGETNGYSYVSIGWGDRGFYLDTPQWKDLKASTVARAVFVPSPTVLHVRYQREPLVLDNQRRVLISDEQYAKLVEVILDSLKQPTDDSGLQRTKIDFSYLSTDAFYEANGSYHAFNTCNCWAADALQSAGVCVPRYSPFPWSVQMYFPTDRL